MGLLKIEGAIDLAQFWPIGEADADTTKIQINVGEGSFSFAADGTNFERTDVLDSAIAVGQGAKEIVRNNKVTVRLQGVDAPELHYKASALKTGAKGVTVAKRKKFNELNKHERRQHWAESATVALRKHIAEISDGDMVPCTVLSLVDTPSELVDTYGRVVADIFIGDATVSLNRWLVRNGWAVPTFYSSMTSQEIETLLADLVIGRKKKRAIAANVTKVPKFNPDLVYRRPSEKPKTGKDDGPVLMPKLFRRQLSYEMQKAAKIFTGNFKTFLEESPDQVFLTHEFLELSIHTAQEYFLDMFITPGGKIEVMPEELVYKEKPSRVVDAQGKIISAF
jgi:endonuclease YncB( thermonuclease family)